MATLMQVIIRTLTGNHIRIGVEPNDPVRELKRLIEERTGVPIDRQRLIFAGKLLEDHRSLAYYKITEDSTIHLVLSLKHDNPPKIWNTYIDSKPILTEPVSSPIALQYTSAHPSITKIDSRIVSQCKNYQELFLKLWFENHQMYPESSTKTSDKRLAKYKEILSNIYKRSVCIYGEPHKGWKSDARKVLPIVLAKCGYSEAEIELVKDTKLFDIVDAFKFIEQRRIELINETTPAPELVHFFFNQHDLVLGSLMPHLSLCDRMHFSNTCKEFNSMARQPIVWRHLCLLHDRARVRDKHFMNILQQYGSYIQALSVQKCLRLTEISLMLIGDKCPNLRILNAADNPLFDHDEQNAVFMKASKLQVINLSLTSLDPLPKPIGRIDVLKELKELNISGRRQTKDGAITHETLKVLDIRGSITGSLNINCSQLEVLFVDQPHTHPKQTMQRTAKIYISHGASDPQSFEGKEANSSDQLDEYRVVNS